MAQGYASAMRFTRGVLDATVAASSAINTTETIIGGGASSRQLLANQLVVGSSCRTTIFGTCTSTVANASTFRIRFGANGTTADTAILTATTGVAATSGTNIAFAVIIEWIVRTIGASGTVSGTCTLINQGTTGISAAATQVIAMTVAAINTTVASFYTVTYQSAAVTTTSTFQNVANELF